MRPLWAYLRARGGTCLAAAAVDILQGLSPRTRRNRASRIDGLLRAWGLSPRTRRNRVDCSGRSSPMRAYLRARGGTRASARTRNGQWAYLRARGGTAADAVDVAGSGPISAHAEEPRQLQPITARQGLSPRTRRNHGYAASGARVDGPISAHAEEPPRQLIAARWAYLRARGGTSNCDRAVSRRGPISAHAEEPGCGKLRSGRSGLSPRTRRNRDSVDACQRDRQGLSPRTRRNRVVDQSVALSRAYLRARGGTTRAR